MNTEHQQTAPLNDQPFQPLPADQNQQQTYPQQQQYQGVPAQQGYNQYPQQHPQQYQKQPLLGGDSKQKNLTILVLISAYAYLITNIAALAITSMSLSFFLGFEYYDSTDDQTMELVPYIVLLATNLYMFISGGTLVAIAKNKKVKDIVLAKYLQIFPFLVMVASLFFGFYGSIIQIITIIFALITISLFQNYLKEQEQKGEGNFVRSA